jgi:hypothetical protein
MTQIPLLPLQRINILSLKHIIPQINQTISDLTQNGSIRMELMHGQKVTLQLSLPRFMLIARAVPFSSLLLIIHFSLVLMVELQMEEMIGIEFTDSHLLFNAVSIH